MLEYIYSSSSSNSNSGSSVMKNSIFISLDHLVIITIP